MSAKGIAKKSQWLKCSRCNTKVYATVITKHMWKSHRAHMMKNRGGRKAETEAEPQPYLLLPDEAPNLRANYFALPGKTLTITVHQGKNYVEISNVTLVEISE